MALFTKNKLDPFLVTFVNVLARASHLLFFLVVGNTYGVTTITDAVIYLQAPVMVLLAVVASAVDTVVMPMLHRADGKDTAKFLFYYVTKRIVIYTMFISGIVLVLFSLISQSLDWGLMTILITLPLFGSLAALKTATLNASNKFKEALLGPLFGGAIAVPVVLMAPHNVYSLALSFLFFEVGKYLGLSTFSDITTGGRSFRSSIGEDIAEWASSNARWQVLGAFVLSSILLVDIWFATSFGTGSVTYIEYANKLWNIVPLLFVGHITITYAKFSRSASRSVYGLYECSIHPIAIRYGLIALLVSLILMYFTEDFIRFLYGFGVVGLAEQKKIATLLQSYLLGAGPYVCGLIYVRAFSAIGQVRVLATVACIGLIINVCGDLFFIHFFGLVGIGLATSFVYLVNLFSLSYWYERMRNNRKRYAI